MKTKLTSLLAVAFAAILVNLNSASAQTWQSWPNWQPGQSCLTWTRIVGPSSPSLTSGYINIFAFPLNGYQTDFNNTAYLTDPSALCLLNVGRISECIYYNASTPAMWDTTNNPTGNFSGESGSRFALLIDISSTNEFFVSDIVFHLLATEPNHSINYSGNLATNTSSPFNVLTFSRTLRGFNGTNSYNDGQSLTNPVKRVLAVLRIGYQVTGQSNIVNTLNYGKSLLPLGFGFQATVSSPVTNMTSFLPTQPYVLNPRWDGTNYGPFVEGQRHMSLTYNVERLYGYQTNKTDWVYMGKTGADSFIADPAGYDTISLNNMIAYRAFPTAPTPPEYNKSSALSSAAVEAIRASLVVENGPE